MAAIACLVLGGALRGFDVAPALCLVLFGIGLVWLAALERQKRQRR